MVTKQRYQLELMPPSLIEPNATFIDPAFARNRDQPIHRWVGWVAGYSADFVRDVLHRYAHHRSLVLDPFAGVGTTLVEGISAGHSVIGFEINPYAALACRIKANIHNINVTKLRSAVAQYRSFAQAAQGSSYISQSQPPVGFHSRAEFFAPAVLKKVLILLDYMKQLELGEVRDLFELAFAATMVSYSQYSYEPSLSRRVTAGKPAILDADVCGIICDRLAEFAQDIAHWKRAHRRVARAKVFNDSFFNYTNYLESDTVDLVITSPPYLNNYHYNRNTRPQIFWLNLVESSADMRYLEHANFGKFWQTVRDQPPISLNFEAPNSHLYEALANIRTLNPEKGIYGGAGWANYATSYFNDCYRFAQALQVVMRPGGYACVVIGNSIVQGILIPTDQYFGEIAQLVGLDLVRIEIPRSTRVGNSIIRSGLRVAAQEKHSLYEAVVVLRKP